MRTVIVCDMLLGVDDRPHRPVKKILLIMIFSVCAAVQKDSIFEQNFYYSS